MMDTTARLDAARGALPAAEAEERTTADLHREARELLGQAEAIYDAEPTDENGAIVIKAREGASLAGLRADRAASRADAARQMLANIEAEARAEEHRAHVAALRAEIAAREADAARARRAAADARAEADAADPVIALPSLLAADRARSQKAAHAAARAARAARDTDSALEAARDRLVAADPGASAEIESAREQNARRRLAELTASIGRPAYLLAIAPAVAVLVAIEEHLRATVAHVRELAAAQQAATEEAGPLAERFGVTLAEPITPEDADAVARVLVRRAIAAGDPGRTAKSLAPWIDAPPGTGDRELFAFACRLLAQDVDHAGNVSAAEAVEIFVQTGRPRAVLELHYQRKPFVELARQAADGDRLSDPVQRGVAAVKEMQRSLELEHWHGGPARRAELEARIAIGRDAYEKHIATAGAQRNLDPDWYIAPSGARMGRAHVEKALQVPGATAAARSAAGA